MAEFEKIAASLRHCAAGIGHCRECCRYGETRCIEKLKTDAADVIERLLRAMDTPLRLGDTAFFLVENEEGELTEIAAERVTGVSYKGFFYSGYVDEPEGTHAFVGWDELGTRAFRTSAEAEEAIRERSGT